MTAGSFVNGCIIAPGDCAAARKDSIAEPMDSFRIGVEDDCEAGERDGVGVMPGGAAETPEGIVDEEVGGRELEFAAEIGGTDEEKVSSIFWARAAFNFILRAWAATKVSAPGNTGANVHSLCCSSKNRSRSSPIFFVRWFASVRGDGEFWGEFNLNEIGQLVMTHIQLR